MPDTGLHNIKYIPILKWMLKPDDRMPKKILIPIVVYLNCTSKINYCKIKYYKLIFSWNNFKLYNLLPKQTKKDNDDMVLTERIINSIETIN